MDANALGFGMIALAIGLTWIALKTTFYGLKIIAGAWWFVMFIYFKENAPAVITEGGGLHTALLVISIGMGAMVVLSGLGRGIQRTERWGNGTEQEEGFKWKLPGWLKTEDSITKRKNSVDKELIEYRETLRQAYRRKEHRWR